MKQWTDDEIEILRQYYGKIPTSEIHKLYLQNRSPISIGNKAWSLDLPAYSPCPKYGYIANREFFKEPNVINSYFAGWLAADGWITKNCIGIECSKNDLILLENFKVATNNNYPITIRNRGLINKFKNDKKQYYAHDTVSHKVYKSQQWIKDLSIYWNVVRNKTKNLQPPNLTDQLHKYAYIVGYFDGDGHISNSFSTREKRYTFQMGFTSCSKNQLEWIREQIKILCPNESWNDGVKQSKKRNYYSITWAYNKGINIHQTLNTIVDIPYKLSRKWNINYDAGRRLIQKTDKKNIKEEILEEANILSLEIKEKD